MQLTVLQVVLKNVLQDVPLFFVAISQTRYLLELALCLLLGVFLGIVAVSVCTAIATRRFKRSNWAFAYALCGALLLWIASLAFAVNCGVAADYPLAGQRYGLNSLEHQRAIAEASKVLTTLLFAPAIGSSLGVILSPGRVPRRRWRQKSKKLDGWS
jgi:H+/Cl- antiporter ClcA